MSSRNVVDPELRPLADQLALAMESFQEEGFLQGIDLAQPSPGTPPLSDTLVAAGEVHVPGEQGAPPVRLVLYRAHHLSGALPVLLHIHGGGYVGGFPEMCDARNRRIAAEVGCVVASVEYRLAPGAHAPAQIEDCYAALRWLHSAAHDLQIDRGRIAVGGESAGGGLAAALCLLARDRGEFPIAFQLLTYPMLDDRTGSTRTVSPFLGEFVWNADLNRRGWTALLGKAAGGGDVSAYAAAARSSDFSGLPPTFIAVGSIDLFLEEDLDYARRLAAAGVGTELHVYPGAFHGFDFLAPTATVSVRLEQDLKMALKRAFAYGVVRRG